MAYFMRASANPGPGFVTWAADIEDYAGTYAPSAIQAGTVIVTSECFNTYGKLGLDHNPVALYLFNGNLNDSSPYNHHLSGSVTEYTTNALDAQVGAINAGTTLYRSSYDGYLSISRALTIQAIGSFLWNTDLGTICSFGCPDESEAGNTMYLYYITADGKLGIISEHGSGSNDTSTSIGVVPCGVPSHLAVTRDSSGTNVKFYINGVFSGSNIITAPTGGNSSSNVFRVFASNGDALRPPNGTLLSCLKINNIELTQDQIIAEYNRSVGNRIQYVPDQISWEYMWTADSGLTLSGSNVVSWANTVDGYQAIRADASGPTYSATGFMSNRPGITFNGTNTFLRCDNIASNIINGLTSFSVAIQFSLNSLSHNSLFYSAQGSVFDHWDRAGVSPGASNAVFHSRNGGSSDDDFTGLIPSLNTEYIVIMSYNTSTATFRMNASPMVSYACNTQSLNLQKCSLGAQIDGAGNLIANTVLMGTVRRMAFIKSALSNDQVASIFYNWYEK